MIADMNETKITIEVGPNLQEVFKLMLKEISTYSSASNVNEGLKIIGEILTKLIAKDTTKKMISGEN